MKKDCIVHLSDSRSITVYNDYRQVVGGDVVAAAILGILGCWAQEAIASSPSLVDASVIWVGSRRVAEIEEALCGISTDKQIRTRLKKLEKDGFIKVEGKATDGISKCYCFMRSRVQEELNNLNKKLGGTNFESPGFCTHYCQKARKDPHD